MKIAIFSDIHDNHRRWEEAVRIIKKEKINIGICCGDVQTIETLETVARDFEEVYLALGNADYDIKIKTGLMPENVEWAEEVLEFELDGLRIGLVHNDFSADQAAKTQKYDIVFYGHTHTPWERIVGKTVVLNPGEICGRYGRASFALFDTKTLRSKLIILE
jgi:putative phosphoesterase